MSKTLKIIALAVAALVALAAIAAAIFAATFNPNDYKPQLIRLVEEKKQRTLAIPGEIKLSFFPKLGVQLGQVSLSEHKGSAEFASFNQARVSLALLPLLRRQLVVDQVSLDGMQARLRRNADGSTNFDDLLAQEPGTSAPQPEEQPAAEQFGFNISGIDISNAHVSFDDLQAKRQVELADLDLETGKIANGVPSQLTLAANVKSSTPAVAARVAMKSGFTIDLGRKHYILRGMDAEIKGQLLEFTDALLRFSGDADLQPDIKRFALERVKLAASGKRAAQALELRVETPKLALTDTAASGGKLNGEVKLLEGARNISATFSAPSFEGSPQAFKLPSVALDVAIKEGKLDATAKLAGNISGDIDKLLFQSPQLKLALAGRQGDTAIDGNLTTPLAINLKTKRIDLPAIVAAFALPNPGGGSLKLNAAGNASVDLDKSSLSTALKGKLDESSFDAKFGMAPFSPAAYTFDIDIDRINADRYLGKGATPATQVKPAGKPAGQAGGAGASAGTGIDLSALRELRARGTLKVGALTIHNIKASKLSAALNAGDGKLAISPLSANLYGGSASGALSATASNAPRFALKQNLAGIDVGSLLKDAIDKQPIDGRGNVTLDVSSAGGGFDQIKKSLNGSARLELRDGAVHGVNVAQAIRKAKARIGELRGQQADDAGTGSVAEKTDFSELSGSFSITNGVAHNNDLSLKSPLIRLGGAGDIDLGTERLDYLTKVTVVSTLQGQGGPELQALKGLTIPVRLTGPFTAIGWRIDFAGLAQEAAKEKIQEKKTEVQEKARKRLQEELKGLFGK